MVDFDNQQLEGSSLQKYKKLYASFKLAVATKIMVWRNSKL